MYTDSVQLYYTKGDKLASGDESYVICRQRATKSLRLLCTNGTQDIKKRESEKESKRHRSTKTLKDINVGDSKEQRAKILTTLVVRQPCQDPKKTNSKKKQGSNKM